MKQFTYTAIFFTCMAVAGWMLGGLHWGPMP